MALGLRGRLGRSVMAIAVALPLAVSVAGATPVAAVSPAVQICVRVAPTVSAFPLMSNTQYYNMGQTRTFRLIIRNNMACDLEWTATSYITSVDGHVWGDVPGGPTSGIIPGEFTIVTTYVVTAPVTPFGRADQYIRLYTGAGNRGFHWVNLMMDGIED